MGSKQAYRQARPGSGLLFLATDSLQLDAKIEMGIYGGEPNVSLGFGASMLF